MTVPAPRSNSRSAAPARRVTRLPRTTLCDWGTPMASLSEDKWDPCRHEFRGHCIGRHGLDAKNTERICGFDLQALTFDTPALQQEQGFSLIRIRTNFRRLPTGESPERRITRQGG